MGTGREWRWEARGRRLARQGCAAQFGSGKDGKEVLGVLEREIGEAEWGLVEG